jgi:hypothetical protein
MPIRWLGVSRSRHHFERAKPPAEGNLMLRLDMLIAKNQDLLLYEDIDNLIEEFFVQLF